MDDVECACVRVEVPEPSTCSVFCYLNCLHIYIIDLLTYICFCFIFVFIFVISLLFGLVNKM